MEELTNKQFGNQRQFVQRVLDPCPDITEDDKFIISRMQYASPGTASMIIAYYLALNLRAITGLPGIDEFEEIADEEPEAEYPKPKRHYRKRKHKK